MSNEPENASRPEARDLEAIFDDLRKLAQADGALHDISSIMYRDWVVTIDVEEGKVVADPEQRWSITKLNNNELMLLLGLMVQSSSDRTYAVVVTGNEFERTADKLLREFHDRLVLDFAPNLDDALTMMDDKLGAAAREAIYYGADSFYLHQFERFSRNRYRDDFEWLIQNAGASARPMAETAQFILEYISWQMTTINEMRKEGIELNKADLTDSLLIAKRDLIEKFGSKAEAFISKFATPVTNANAAFVSPFAINQVNLAPLIDLGEDLYAPNSYRLFESIYESPFYWMLADPSYREVGAKHRGAFLERTAVHLFRSVFGKANVHENVTIHRSKKETAGEARRSRGLRGIRDRRAGEIQACDVEGKSRRRRSPFERFRRRHSRPLPPSLRIR